MRARGTCLVILLLVWTATACDRVPTEPSLETTDAWLSEPGARTSVYAPSSTSLPQLFRSAAAKVLLDHGADAQKRLLADWRRLNEAANSALKSGDRGTAQTRIAALRAEEVRTVLRVFGDRVVQRTILAIDGGLAKARRALASAEAAGHQAERGRALAAQVDGRLIQARAALQAGDYPEALERAVEASDLLDSVVHFTISLNRIAGLETLFPAVLDKIGHERGDAAVNSLIADLERINGDARLALRRGDRDRARQHLESARAEQIRIVLDAIGPTAITRLAQAVDSTVAATRKQVANLAEPLATDRVSRMLSEAAGLNARARAALLRGDRSTALDLASHAAGLVNAAQHLLPR
jgi:hypothetical protein